MSTKKRREAASQLVKVGPRMGRFMRRALETMPEPQSLLRHAALRTLAQRTCGNAELASELSVANPTMSGLVDQLVKAGWVERRDDPGDRRAVRLVITEAGLREVEKSQQRLIDATSELMSGLDDEAVDGLIKGLAGIDAALAGSRPDCGRAGIANKKGRDKVRSAS